MRSRTSRALPAAALLLAACGNYSTEDLRFTAALPTRQDLNLDVPVQASAQAQGAAALTAAGAQLNAAAPCAPGAATAWLWAKPASEGMRAGLDLLLGLVDAVRGAAPSWREADARGWGPWADERHAGRELQGRLTRTFPDGTDAAPSFAYVLQARVAGNDAWTPVLEARLRGGSATRGAGEIVLHLDRLAYLGMADPGAPVAGTLTARYDRTGSPVRIALVVDEPGFGLPAFGYAFAGYPDRSGAFTYAVRSAAGELFVIDAAFDGAGRGRATVELRAPSGASASYGQCWDASACVVWVDDPLDVTRLCAGPPCTLGSPASCPAVP